VSNIGALKVEKTGRGIDLLFLHQKTILAKFLRLVGDIEKIADCKFMEFGYKSH
jgi:hypothetical protein